MDQYSSLPEALMLKHMISSVPRKDQEILDMLTSHQNSHIWIFGASGLGIAVKRYLIGKGIRVYSFCDNDQSKVGTMIDGVPVRSFWELRQDDDRIVLISIWKFFDEVSYQCRVSGISFYDAAPLAGVVFDTIEESAEFVSQNLRRIAAISEKLSDSISAEIYFAAQTARLFRDRGTMQKYRGGMQYIDRDIASLGKNEVIFICGAGNGNSAIEFSKLSDGNANICCFEPDADNFSQLRNKTACMPNLHLIPYGLGEKSGVQLLSDGMGENSTFSGFGKTSVQVTSIDGYVKHQGMVPSYITMDIEGWEMKALHGAQNTISEHKPKLAVSLYHRASDFVEIPEYIFSLRPDYLLYVRHYTDSYSDTIAYFI